MTCLCFHLLCCFWTHQSGPELLPRTDMLLLLTKVIGTGSPRLQVSWPVTPAQVWPTGSPRCRPLEPLSHCLRWPYIVSNRNSVLLILHNICFGFSVNTSIPVKVFLQGGVVWDCGVVLRIIHIGHPTSSAWDALWFKVVVHLADNSSSEISVSQGGEDLCKRPWGNQVPFLNIQCLARWLVAHC